MDDDYPSPPPSPRVEDANRILSHTFTFSEDQFNRGEAGGQLNFSDDDAHLWAHLHLSPTAFINAAGDFVESKPWAEWAKYLQYSENGRRLPPSNFQFMEAYATKTQMNEDADYMDLKDLLDGTNDSPTKRWDIDRIPFSPDGLQKYNDIRGAFKQMGYAIRTMHARIESLSHFITRYFELRDEDPGGFFSAREIRRVEKRLQDAHGGVEDAKAYYYDAERKLKAKMTALDPDLGPTLQETTSIQGYAMSLQWVLPKLVENNSNG